jgi:hypothetical protein
MRFDPGATPTCNSDLPDPGHNGRPSARKGDRPVDRRQRVSLSLASLLQVLDDGVRAREHQARVAIIKVHQVRRLSPAAVHLDDLAGMLGLADDLAMYMEPVTDYRLHRVYLPSFGRGHSRAAAGAASAAARRLPRHRRRTRTAVP